VGYQLRSGIGVFGSSIVPMGFLTLAVGLSAAQTSRATGASAPDWPRSIEEIVREIDDPATGDRWLLERDLQHPGGPGRMVLAAPEKALPAPAGSSAGSVRSGFETAASPALIRAGDHLIVEQHTRLLDAVLEAIALAPAREGETFRVRLSIGGRVVKAVAIAPGHAVLSPDSGARP
jgi:hypothetical protein